jgi:competence protein ComEC
MLILQVFPPVYEETGLPENGSLHTCEGQVYRIEMQTDQSVLYLKTNSEKIICYFADNSFVSQLKMGNRIAVTGKCRRFSEAVNEGQFDAKQYYGILGIAYSMTACEGTVISMQTQPYRQGLYRIRCQLSRSFASGLPDKYAGVMQAMLLGEKSGMDEELKELYQRNGIAHVLAISGLHITFLGMGLLRLCKKLRLPHWLGSLLSVCLIISFGEMTGAGASTVRSVIMFALFLLAGNCGRTYDTLTALAISAVGLLLYQPRYISHSGFLLSFGSVMGMALISPMLREQFPKETLAERMTVYKGQRQKIRKKCKEWLISSLCTSFGIILATLPIQLFFYYTFPTYSFLLNLWIIPLMGLLLPAGVAGSILAWILPTYSTLFCMPCRGILTLYEWLCGCFDLLPGSHLVPGKPAVWKILIYYSILSAVFLWNTYGRKKAEHSPGIRAHKQIELGILVLAIFILCVRWRSTTTCTMLDVGQGDCLVIEEKNGKNLLIDGGSSDVSKVGKYRIVPYLKSHGISRIDYAFLSHKDTDHISGILELLNDAGNLGVTIDCLVLTKFAMEDTAYAEILEAAEQSTIRILLIGADDYLLAGEVKLRCLYPGIADTAEGNDQSMILLMECGTIKTLFTGDMTEEKETNIAWEDIDILKVAHHGSRYSTTSDFLDKTTPSLALISCGRDNRYNHPHDETLQRLSEIGTTVFRTDRQGAVTIYFQKEKVKLKTFIR